MKYHKKRWKTAGALSLPVRGAWVEITFMVSRVTNMKVAPRAGSVG